MTLAAGTKLGVFEITGQLGAGGMGEVYKATDTKLGREVAIKTLPSSIAADKERLARFEREAKVLAALNHAHRAGGGFQSSATNDFSRCSKNHHRILFPQHRRFTRNRFA